MVISEIVGVWGHHINCDHEEKTHKVTRASNLDDLYKNWRKNL